MPYGRETTELTTELFMDQVDRDAVSPDEKRRHKLVALSTLIFAMLAALVGAVGTIGTLWDITTMLT